MFGLQLRYSRDNEENFRLEFRTKYYCLECLYVPLKTIIMKSQLYKDAVEKGFDLPEDYAGYSFHDYTTKPLPTDSLSPEEILKFRDEDI